MWLCYFMKVTLSKRGFNDIEQVGKLKDVSKDIHKEKN